MIAGYVTYNELKIITGYSDVMLTKLLIQGINSHELEITKGIRKEKILPLKEQLFNLNEVERWIKVHIF